MKIAGVFLILLLLLTLLEQRQVAPFVLIPTAPFAKHLVKKAVARESGQEAVASIVSEDKNELVENETTSGKKSTTTSDEFVQRAFERMDEHPLFQNNNRDDDNNDAQFRPASARVTQSTQTKTQYQQEEQQDEHYYESLPFSLIVGQDLVKRALLIAAVDPSLSVLLHGPKGTGKSILARALYHLLPSWTTTLDGDTTSTSSSSSSSMVPKIHVPLHCQEDALLGTVDLERSLAQGQAVLEPGLLQKAHQGLLIVDDVQLLEPELTHILWNAVESKVVTVEREGLSATYPCCPLAIATMNPEEGDDTVQSWLDRISIRLPVETTLSVPDRVKVVENMESFVDHKADHPAMAQARQQDDILRANVVEGRRTLPFVQPLSHEQLLYLATEATAADCEGQRGEVHAAKIAKASAALQQRVVVNGADLQLGVLLAIAPRARRWNIGPAPPTDSSDDPSDEEAPSLPPENELQPLPPPPLDLPPESQNELDDEETTPEEEEEEEEEPEPEHETNQEETEPEEILIPDEFMFSPDFSTPLDPRLIQFQQWTRKGKKGKGSKIFNLKRGRFVKAVFPPPGMIHQGKIAVGATLRSAAPFQKSRREHAEKSKLIYIRDDDIRLQRMKRKAGSLVLFVVDASGSMALNRMSAAKGAALTLLQEAYKSRDRICLIAFHDNEAEVLVPPTKSMALASTRLDQMPCGGRSPLAHAMATAMSTGLNAVKVKQDVGRVVVVLITDGRPTIPLCVSEGRSFDAATMAEAPSDVKEDGQASRKFCEKEVYAIAKQLGAASSDLDLLVIDTEDKFVATGVAKEIARLSQGTYYALDAGKASDILAATRKHVEASHAAQ